MSWKPQESYIVAQGIEDISSSAKLPMGTIVKASHPSLGMGEFMYAKGVASTVVGSVVTIDEAGVTALAAADGKGRIGCAMAANVANNYGWYQIGGKGVAKVLTGFADDGICYLTATAGSVDDAAVAGDLVHGMMGRADIGTPSAGKAYVELNRPFVDDATEG
jgi:hypothetical protein